MPFVEIDKDTFTHFGQVRDVLAPGFYDYKALGGGVYHCVATRKPPETGYHLPKESTGFKFLEQYAAFKKKIPILKRAGANIRRSWLMYGAPGTGKTTAIKALVHHAIAENCVVVNFSNPSMMKYAYEMIRKSEPERFLVFISEDCDRTMRNDDPILSNFLDGVIPLTNIAIVFTTNYLNTIPATFRRAGRIDCSIEFGNLQESERRAFFENLNAKGKFLGTKMIDFLVQNSDKKSLAIMTEMFTRAILSLSDDETKMKEDSDKLSESVAAAISAFALPAVEPAKTDDENEALEHEPDGN